jgi:hypothetical protein
VWHARTRLYEEVQQLRGQAKRDEATIAELRNEAGRNEADRDALQAEIARLQPGSPASNYAPARAERPSPGESAEGEPGFSPDDDRLEDVTQRFWRERERLLADIRRGEAVGTEEERKKLLDFLLDALKQVERVSPNGSEAIAEPREQDQNHGSSVFAPESENFGPSSQ